MSITFPTTPWLVAGAGAQMIHVNLRYEPNKDPYAVALVTLMDQSRPVTWLFARDMLRDGLTRPVVVRGGDVRVTPGGSGIAVHLASSDGRSLLLFDRHEISMFVDSIYLQVPAGRETERLDWSDIGEVLA